MDRPFDLERAKKGQCFYRKHSAIQLIYRFVGVRNNGSIVFESLDGLTLLWAPEEELEMLPVETRKWINIYRFADGAMITGGNVYDTEEEARKNNSKNSSYLGPHPITIKE